MDEVELFIRGCEDRKRFYRFCSYKIAEAFRGSKGMPSLISFLPLDYDFELQETPENALAFYEQAIKNFPQWN